MALQQKIFTLLNTKVTDLYLGNGPDYGALVRRYIFTIKISILEKTC